ncbi:putative threonine efflux protein [Vibrio variabilis]|uniref:Threonine efflux protein n=1 Tax=Vibrio variabilis TaxID=990271 RepID=A0ABQ0JI76_9VIBR|nr:putative threonine efflux protein [Vibrio variabilis]
MTFTIWLSLLAICLLGAMSPGPSLAIVAKHSLAGGDATVSPLRGHMHLVSVCMH